MNLLLGDLLRIPTEFESLDEFRQWTRSADYPERGNVYFLSGDLWVDVSMETLLHNQLKGQIAAVLTLLAARLGMYCGDRMRLVNLEADISCEPDCILISHKSRKAGRATWEAGADSLEVIGSPDMVLEIVSAGSVQKDTVILRELYEQAKISEYWLVHPQNGKIRFEILRHTAEGYVPVRKIGGWAKSKIFAKSFRIAPASFGDELPQFQLLVQ